MKKSKLLMPLTGIAAIGAIAPVAVMTSCHKNEAKIFSEVKIENDGIFGAKSYAKDKTIDVTFKATLSAMPEASHVFKRSIAKDYTSNYLKIAKTTEDQTITEFKAAKGSLTYYATASKLVTVLNDATTITKDETLTFTVTYKEYDSGKTDAKLVKTQDVEYTITLVANKLDRPTVTAPAAYTGIVTDDDTKAVKVGGKGYNGLALSTAVTANKFVIDTTSTDDLTVNPKESTLSSTLTITHGTAALDEDNQSITMTGKVGEVPTAASGDVYALGENDSFVLTLSFEDKADIYAKTKWTQDIVIEACEFTIAPKA